jgi:hypothetical protein
MLCCDTPRAFIMLSTQTTSASVSASVPASAERGIIFSVSEALGVEAFDLATAAHVPESIPSPAGASRFLAGASHAPGQLEAFHWNPARGTSRQCIESNKAAKVYLCGISFYPPIPVIGSHENLAAGDNRVAVTLAAKRGHPGNVFAGL